MVRGEVTYTNHASYESNKPFDLTGQRYSDVMKYMVAIDVDQAYAPWLTATGNLTSFLELQHTIVMDNCKLCFLGNDLGNEHQLKNDVDHYNDKSDGGAPIKMWWDFTDDMDDLDQPREYTGQPMEEA